MLSHFSLTDYSLWDQILNLNSRNQNLFVCRRKKGDTLEPECFFLLLYIEIGSADEFQQCLPLLQCSQQLFLVPNQILKSAFFLSALVAHPSLQKKRFCFRFGSNHVDALFLSLIFGMFSSYFSKLVPIQPTLMLNSYPNSLIYK